MRSGNFPPIHCLEDWCPKWPITLGVDAEGALNSTHLFTPSVGRIIVVMLALCWIIIFIVVNTEKSKTNYKAEKNRFPQLITDNYIFPNSHI